MDRPVNQATTLHLGHEDPIKRWQEQAESESEAKPYGLIARLFSHCLDLLKYLLQNLESGTSTKRDRNVLQRCNSLLRVWARGYGALTGDLDTLLDRSRTLRQTVLCILHPLCHALVKGLQKRIRTSESDLVVNHLLASAVKLCDQTRWLLTDINDSTSDNDSDSDSDSAASSSDVWDRSEATNLAQSIKTYTDCLIDLGSALDYPALEPYQEGAPGLVTLELRSADDYHTALIRAKFPQAEISLLQHLGQASWSRYQRMQKEREVNAYGEVTLISNEKSQIAKSEFKDSGIGTSLPQATSAYAETVVSFMTSISGGQRVNIPPLPTEAKAGLPFKPFVSRQLWGDHLEIEHGFGPKWHGIECPLCCETTPDGKSAILIHFSRHMEDIALASLPRDVESEVDSDSNPSSRLTATSVSMSGTVQVTHDQSSAGNSATNPAIDISVAIEQLKNTIGTHDQKIAELLSLQNRRRRSDGKREFKYHELTGFVRASGEELHLATSEDVHRMKSQYEQKEQGWLRRVMELERAEGDDLGASINQSDNSEASATKISTLGISSYWHVNELRSFKKMIAYFGTDFTEFSHHLKTKTPVMIRNQYLRLVEGGDTSLEQAAKNADTKRERGDDRGSPPRLPDPPRRRHPIVHGDIGSSKQVVNGGEPMNLHQSGNTDLAQVQSSAQKRDHESPNRARLCSSQTARESSSADESRADAQQHSEASLPAVNYTKTGRVSKAKTGLRVHECECGRSYTRAAHLRRHQKNHAQEGMMFCKHHNCGKSFYRADLLQRHEERHIEVENRSRRSSFDIAHESSSLFPIPSSEVVRRDLDTSYNVPIPGDSENCTLFPDPKKVLLPFIRSSMGSPTIPVLSIHPFRTPSPVLEDPDFPTAAFTPEAEPPTT
ncbi:hypothetical protein OPT61_g3797 [Boeremia exigua]|uniref:Uncharacterized protein n=1 Tax=Boeremia exigua TaxID=749465 RepID=A0ACC2IGJ5_9PLEO|nr:hypothetical protein OPT61_g3797 [Boeremia exigua]